MAGTNNVHHIQIVLFDQPVEVDIEKIHSRRRAPVPQQPRLDMLEREGRFEQRIVSADRSARLKGNLPRANRRAFFRGDRATRDWSLGTPCVLVDATGTRDFIQVRSLYFTASKMTTTVTTVAQKKNNRRPGYLSETTFSHGAAALSTNQWRRPTGQIIAAGIAKFPDYAPATTFRFSFPVKAADQILGSACAFSQGKLWKARSHLTNSPSCKRLMTSELIPHVIIYSVI